MLSAFGINPAEFPHVLPGGASQPLQLTNTMGPFTPDTGYMGAARSTRAAFTAGDQPTITAPLVIGSRHRVLNHYSHPGLNAEDGPHTRLAPGMPLFIEDESSNMCSVALSLPDLNARLFANRNEHAYRCGQAIADHFTPIGMVSATLDPTFGYTQESVQAVWRQQRQIHANAVVDGTTPGVSAIGCDSKAVFATSSLSGHAAAHPPRPCPGTTVSASVYLVLMPVTCAYVEGTSRQLTPTTEELTAMISRRPTQPFKIDYVAQPPPVVGDLVTPARVAVAAMPANVGPFGFAPPPAGAIGMAVRAGIPPAAGVLNAISPPGLNGVGNVLASVDTIKVCYQFVPFMTMSPHAPSPESFVAYAGPSAPFVKVYPLFTTSVDHSAMHGAPRNNIIARNLIHPPMGVKETIVTVTTQAVFEMQPV